MDSLRRTAAIVLTIIAAIAFAGPVIWIAVASLSTNAQINTDPLGVGGLHFENYVDAWNQAHIGQFVLNSVLVSIGSSLVIAFVATCAGYAIARLRFPGRSLVTALVLVALAAPVITYVQALSDLATDWHLLDLRSSIVVVNAGIFVAVPTLVITSFFRRLPEELMEAARLDGASERQTFTRVMVPLARPAIILALTFAFVWAWNAILVPVVLLQSPDKYTIPQGLSSLRNDAYTPNFARVFAAAIISALPMVALYWQLERRSVEVLAAGSVRG
jgi:ABC-type glycerol-3-phosphate transport system permease component